MACTLFVDAATPALLHGKSIDEPTMRHLPRSMLEVKACQMVDPRPEAPDYTVHTYMLCCPPSQKPRPTPQRCRSCFFLSEECRCCWRAHQGDPAGAIHCTLWSPCAGDLSRGRPSWGHWAPSVAPHRSFPLSVHIQLHIRRCIGSMGILLVRQSYACARERWWCKPRGA